MTKWHRLLTRPLIVFVGDIIYVEWQEVGWSCETMLVLYYLSAMKILGVKVLGRECSDLLNPSTWHC